MKIFKRGTRYGLLMSLGLLVSCTTGPVSVMQANVDEMTPCEKIDGLVSAYAHDFDSIKGRVSSERFMGIWAAKVDAVGKGCQVWLTGDKKTTYVCTRVAPNEAVARDWYGDALDTMAQCLGDWQREDLDRKDDSGRRTVWSKPGKFPIVSAHVLPTNGVYNQNWSLYFFVGDRDDRF